MDISYKQQIEAVHDINVYVHLAKGFHLSVKRSLRHGYRGGGGHVFFAKYTLNLPSIYPIFSSKKNPIFLYNFGQKWLDTLDFILYLLHNQILFVIPMLVFIF